MRPAPNVLKCGRPRCLFFPDHTAITIQNKQTTNSPRPAAL